MSEAAVGTATVVPMPRLSDSMEEGTIVRWLVADGAEVERGEELVEIETDKATMAFEAPAAGQLHVIVDAEHTVAVGAPIARIGEGDGPEAPADEAERPRREPAATVLPPTPEANAPRASPIARRLAAERGIDLVAVSGSGPGGRIVKEDVLAVAAPARPPAQTGARGPIRRERPTRSQAIVARRMTESRATVPDFPVAIEVEIGAALELRHQLKDALDPAPTLNDLIVAAVARALRSHPHLNAAYVDGAFEFYEDINIGVAVAVEDELVVPVLAGADSLSLTDIAARNRELVERTRTGAVTPPELAGGTFTISNLGMFGIAWFQPIVNPPQAAILGVGGIDDRGGRLPTLSLTLVSDHRIVYGATAARFLADVRRLLESPAPLMAGPRVSRPEL